jgi:hypothetical protein
MKKPVLPLPETFVLHATALINHVHSKQAASPSASENNDACFRRSAREYRNGGLQVLVDAGAMRVRKPRQGSSRNGTHP